MTPSVSILAEPSVAWVDKNVAQHGTTDVAKAYMEYFYSEPAHELACRNGFRPTLTSVYGKCPTHFARVDLWTIVNFGGWKTAQAHYFADGGVFEQIYSTK